eukprot:Skav208418  [mRNA]  locus=scaffold2953:216673:221650:+ [translate_table: standard]
MAAHGTVATVQPYTSATDFLHDAAEIFEKREVEHSVMLGVLGNLQKDMDFYHVTPQLLAVKGSGPAPVLLATMVYPYPLVLSLAAPSASDEDVTGALQSLADYVATVLKEKKVFPVKLVLGWWLTFFIFPRNSTNCNIGFGCLIDSSSWAWLIINQVGVPGLVDPFAARLAQISGEERLRPGVSMQFYSVEPSTLVPPRLRLEDDPSLTVRPYEDGDAEWMRTWIQQFHVDVFGYSQDGFVEGQFYAGYGGATANTLRITGVFTPENFRGHGYGQLAAWCACRHLLTPVADHGLGRSAVAIAADQAKSSVMGIYKRLGFAETTEFREYVDHEGLKAADVAFSLASAGKAPEEAAAKAKPGKNAPAASPLEDLCCQQLKSRYRYSVKEGTYSDSIVATITDTPEPVEFQLAAIGALPKAGNTGP